MIRENSTEACILPYVKQTASPGSMHEAGCSGLVHGRTLPYIDMNQPWDVEGGGRGFRMGTHVYPWLIHVNVWQKPPQYLK